MARNILVTELRGSTVHYSWQAEHFPLLCSILSSIVCHMEIAIHTPKLAPATQEIQHATELHFYPGHRQDS